MDSGKRIDITQPLWDQSTFVGRFRHFAFISNPLLSVVPEKELYAAKELYMQYKAGQEPPGTKFEQVVRAKQLYESAFHPDSGELQNVFGRMSFQMPGGCLITGAMLQWYRTATAVVFWQWVNQSFNALVNYTNRNANSPLTTTQMGVAYVSATSAAMATALTFKFYVQKRTKHPIVARFVPFVAVAAANWVNIPLMRQNEIAKGLEVADENGKIIGKSQIAPIKGISQVVTSRIIMCSPGMLLLPFIMERLEKKAWMKRITWAHAGIQTAVVGMFLTFMVPTACAIFPQRCKLSIDTIKKYEKENYEEIVKNTDGKPPQYVYFNKGL
ncbi:sideroflexin-2 isoform X1 [Pectinophora gossypiella]|uniref:Sidoreflexin n=1 Tax=Pectinophora gossypiella TaxID=13191 RepID=A0A1E1WB48_PECGO|nr:sideroflexin-2 isoform X1 [Pectinophora gossypiella]XP_049872777.1 sideroflexin-2 isoform X1 [Pectinophora gossypiella]